MREAVGSSMLLYIVVFFIATIMLLFVGIISYAKAYRTKNRIIEIIEKYGNYGDEAKQEINEDLQKIGYTSINISTDECYSFGEDKKEVYDKGDFAYCISLRCESDSSECDGRGFRYKVKTFMLFEFPVIKNVLKFKVSGETKILGISYDYK